MKNRLKHIQLISCLLFLVFVVPQILQHHHVLTVHHHKLHCTAEGEKHLHEADKHCPIQEYVFAISHKVEIPLQISKPETVFYERRIENTISLKSVEHHQYYLRGPPKV